MHPARWPALDVAKFFCVFFMVFIHGTFWLLATEDEEIVTANFVFPIVQEIVLVGLFPLLIPFLAGFSLRRYLEDRRMGVGMVFKLALALVVLSYGMNLLSWGWDNLEWDALQFIAVSFLLITLVTRVAPSWVVAVLGGLCLAVTLPLREALGTSFFAKVLVGTSDASAFWPFFPWFFTVAGGFTLADLRYRLSLDRYVWGLGVGGALVAGGTYALGGLSMAINPLNIWGPAVFQPSLLFVVGLVGVGALLLALSHGFAQVFELAPRGMVESFSQGILWIYLVHTVVGVHAASWVKHHVPLEVSAIGFPMALLALSWVVGYVAIVLGSKRIRVVLAPRRS